MPERSVRAEASALEVQRALQVVRVPSGEAAFRPCFELTSRARGELPTSVDEAVARAARGAESSDAPMSSMKNGMYPSLDSATALLEGSLRRREVVRAALGDDEL